jgi:hypothetical protein
MNRLHDIGEGSDVKEDKFGEGQLKGPLLRFEVTIFDAAQVFISRKWQSSWV